MKKRLLGILLSFALMLTMMPGMSLTALAWEGDPYASLVNTTTVVKFDGKEWYLIENNSTAANAGTVTLLSKECVGKSAYNSSGSFVTYDNNPTIKGVVDTWYSGNITADAKTAVADDKAFILESLNGINPDVLKCNQVAGTFYNVWWLCSRSSDSRARGVDGDGGYLADGPVKWEYGVRPALKLDLSKVVFDSKSKTFSILTPYPLWVGGTQVTSANMNDVFNDGKVSYTPATTGENPTPAKLTLNNYIYTGEGHNNAAIYANENLTIELNGANTVTQTVSTGNSFGILVDGNNSLNITGSGSLTSNAGTAAGANKSCGIYVGDQLVIGKDTTVTAAGGSCGSQSGGIYGVQADAGLTVNGSLTASGSIVLARGYGVYTEGTMDVGETGTVDATGQQGVYSGNNMTISGSVTAVDTGEYGIFVYGDVIINGDVTAAGSNKAIYTSHNVKNSIAGTGWTNTAGTEGETAIEASTTGQKLTQYKKVLFQAPTYEVTYKVVNGTWSDDSTTDKKETVKSGSKPTSVPTGMKASEGYTGGAWDTDPAEATITGATTFTYSFTAKPTPTPTPAPATTSVTVNTKTVSANTLAAACAKAGVNPDSVATVVLGKKVKKIKKGSFQNLRNANTLVVKSKKLTKARVKGSLKGSSITKVKVKVGKKKTNKYYVKRYKKIFTKKNCGKKVSVSR